jgi:exonuclease V gamma subunit
VQPFPVQYIALIGFDEQFFPCHDDDTFFSYIPYIVSSFSASNVGIDRYRFIEALFSAQHVFIGWQRVPSEVVKELIQHLDTHYRVDNSLPSEMLTLQPKPMAKASHCFEETPALYWPNREEEFTPFFLSRIWLVASGCRRGIALAAALEGGSAFLVATGTHAGI